MRNILDFPLHFNFRRDDIFLYIKSHQQSQIHRETINECVRGKYLYKSFQSACNNCHQKYFAPVHLYNRMWVCGCLNSSNSPPLLDDCSCRVCSIKIRPQMNGLMFSISQCEQSLCALERCVLLRFSREKYFHIVSNELQHTCIQSNQIKFSVWKKQERRNVATFCSKKRRR